MNKALKLKSLIMHGFKSFADRTVFDFHEGMTVLVGPNGCGKSNIVDAVKWVLGDQSAKSVRGKEMIDVIFNGSDKRPPMGTAEVSLVFDNAGRILPVDYETVMITRRLHRDGQSDYELNRNACRLKDIREVFMDTGVGVDAYSIIEQGRVAAFIQANARERRQLFEEASGISRLKARKKEALSKLKRSSQNLERLHDIVDEVSRRLARVKRQADKAQRFKELDSRLRERRLTVAVMDYESMRTREKEVGESLDDRRGELAKIQSEQAGSDSERLEADGALAEANQRVQDLATGLVRVDGEIQRLHDLIEYHTVQSKSIEEERVGRVARLSELERRGGEVEASVTELEAKLTAVVEAIEQVDREVRRAEEAVEDREEELLELGTRLEELRNRVVMGESRLSRLSHLDESAAVQMMRLEREIAEGTSKREAFERERHWQVERRRALEARLIDLGDQRDSLSAELKEQESRSQSLGDEVSRVDEDLSQARLESSRRQAERRVLEDLEKSHAGVSDAVKALLEKGRDNTRLLSGLTGLVAELIKAPAAISRAVDAALGHRAQAVVLESVDLIPDVEEELARSDLGQVAVLALDGLPAAPVSTDPGIPTQGRLIDQLNLEPGHRVLFEHLLGSWWLVDDSTNLSTLPVGISAVTADGRRRDGWGLYVLGRGGDASGLVSRRTHLESLEGTLQRLDTQEANLRLQLDDLSMEQNRYETLLSDMAGRQVRLENAISARSSDLHVLGQETELLNDRRARLEERLRGEEAEYMTLATEREQRVAELTGLDHDLPLWRAEVETVQHSQLSARDSQERQRENLVARRMEHNTRDNERLQFTSSLQHLRESLDDLIEDRTRLEVEETKAVERLELFTRESNEARAGLDSQFTLKTEQEEALGQGRRVRAEVEERKKMVDEKLAELMPRLNVLQEDVSKLHVEQREVVLRREGLVERIREDYSVNVAEEARDWTAPDSEEFDLESWRREAEELKSMIDKLGPVNLEALQEETELDERHTFLAEQEKDLREATRRLEDVVNRIDERARDLFTGTFETVREHFKSTFRSLFGGGRADLKLDDMGEGDVLEGGIEITACPPGKEPRSITLLSGGEKTMTAVALLFAIFKSRPSPFCVLDEVDAALDESNIDRWLAMLDKFKETSQFLVITHSKRTMKDASMIYGVTMQEPGVSCKLSLKFDEIHENGTLEGNPQDKVA